MSQAENRPAEQGLANELVDGNHEPANRRKDCRFIAAGGDHLHRRGNRRWFLAAVPGVFELVDGRAVSA